MTTIEHAFLGVNIVMATGFERRYSWRLAAMCGLCAIAPDWDALTIAYSLELFGLAHRVWGHNFLVCFLVGLLIGCIDYRYDIVSRVLSWFCRIFRISNLDDNFSIRDRFSRLGLVVWIIFAEIGSLSHLVADIVSSGAADLPDWELKLLFPFSERGFIYPMHSWGDVGVTLIFVAGMFAMLKWNLKTKLIARLTLLAIIAYIVW
ncbi:MAG: metal-dependent hydrolase [Planctomycetaceae bacterium]|jgi:membrane-bound metal-dependent hydrolase YbcI (DUF457 family)|nr:metal-dependent hydrolase [Planctomycetaceae bacterium]